MSDHSLFPFFVHNLLLKSLHNPVWACNHHPQVDCYWWAYVEETQKVRQKNVTTKQLYLVPRNGKLLYKISTRITARKNSFRFWNTDKTAFGETNNQLWSFLKRRKMLFPTIPPLDQEIVSVYMLQGVSNVYSHL